jgi:hypothetical protein
MPTFVNSISVIFCCHLEKQIERNHNKTYHRTNSLESWNKSTQNKELLTKEKSETKLKLKTEINLEKQIDLKTFKLVKEIR